ncbi:hypothetical protein ATCC90586_009749 [Pythium insidiosum]|nr:hypothetical protein ATCC90586_009749 [Pythium insidiosum]
MAAKSPLLVLQALLLAIALAALVVQAAETHCSIPPKTYPDAKAKHPHLATALSTLESRGIATWYTDRAADGDTLAAAKHLVASCNESSRITLVVYGLPFKDCEAGYSMVGSRNQNADDYRAFVSQLVDVVGERKVLYILEPDAIGLLAGGGCAAQHGYKENLLTAIEMLSANKNADIYVDVGFWRLFKDDDARRVAEVLQDLLKVGRMKGITLNTSNYRPIQEMATLCQKFKTIAKMPQIGCIIDTSRNFVESSSSEWCNRAGAGIGHPPTADTKLPSIDYFVWVKPPGESDGTCDKDHSKDAMVGPEAGLFFPKAFEQLWDNGYFVKEEKMARVVSSNGVPGWGVALIVVCSIALVLALFVFVRRRAMNSAKGPMRPSFAYNA